MRKINSKLIKALELEKNGNWDHAHKIVQDIENRDSCLIHAYLHRKQGDIGNANYWYSRAGSVMPDKTLAEEWQVLFDKLHTP